MGIVWCDVVMVWDVFCVVGEGMMVCMFVYVCVCAHVYVCWYVYACSVLSLSPRWWRATYVVTLLPFLSFSLSFRLSACVCRGGCVCIYLCVCLCACVGACVCACIRMYVCLCVRVFVYMYMGVGGGSGLCEARGGWCGVRT